MVQWTYTCTNIHPFSFLPRLGLKTATTSQEAKGKNDSCNVMDEAILKKQLYVVDRL